MIGRVPFYFRIVDHKPKVIDATAETLLGKDEKK